MCGFGAPKLIDGNIPTAAILPGIILQTHWMNADDAVPFIPPPATRTTGWALGLSVRQLNRISGFCTYNNGLCITLNNAIVASSIPTSNVPPATSAIGTWLQQQDQGLQTAHSISTYISRLNAIIAIRAGQDAQPAPAPQAPIPVPLAPRDARRLVQELNQTAFFDASRQNAQPARIPPLHRLSRRIGKARSGPCISGILLLR